MKCDVIICGGGLSGLTLAKQLCQILPDLSITVLEKRDNSSSTTHKIGESTVLFGGHYLGEILGLEDYLEHQHLIKLGLRFFFPNADNSHDFSGRPELGKAHFNPGIMEWQLERNSLEKHLYNEISKSGVTAISGTLIRTIELANTNNDYHQVNYYDAEGSPQTLQGRWLIDAMGSRKLLQRKLNLTQSIPAQCSACWFKLPARIDVDTFVSKDQVEWHGRVVGDHPRLALRRYHSTNHLMGRGYWVWIIPLSSAETSIGIVTREDIHPVQHYSSYPKALAWLKTWEPHLAAAIQDYSPTHFQRVKRYSYSSQQVFSDQRWACTGNSAVFSDPLYSQGVDAIAFANSAICELIRLDRQHQDIDALAALLNREFLDWNNFLTTFIQQGYLTFGNNLVGSAYLIFTSVYLLGFSAPLFFEVLFTEQFGDALVAWMDSQQYTHLKQTVFQRCHQMADLFIAWEQKTTSNYTYQWVDYFRGIDFLPSIKLAISEAETHLDAFEAGLNWLQKSAQAFFLLAVQDILPDKLDFCLKQDYINLDAITLDANQWDPEMVFSKTDYPVDQDVHEIYHNLQIHLLKRESKELLTV